MHKRQKKEFNLTQVSKIQGSSSFLDASCWFLGPLAGSPRFIASDHTTVAGAGRSAPFLLSVMLQLESELVLLALLLAITQITVSGLCSFRNGQKCNTRCAKDHRKEICGVSFNSFPSRITPTFFFFFFGYSWGRVGGIDSDSPHTLRGSDSSQLWCSSNSVQNTVGALPQLPRSQTRSDVPASALNDIKFISKLDTHTRIKDSPATNRAQASFRLQ